MVGKRIQIDSNDESQYESAVEIVQYDTKTEATVEESTLEGGKTDKRITIETEEKSSDKASAAEQEEP